MEYFGSSFLWLFRCGCGSLQRVVSCGRATFSQNLYLIWENCCAFNSTNIILGQWSPRNHIKTEWPNEYEWNDTCHEFHNVIATSPPFVLLVFFAMFPNSAVGQPLFTIWTIATMKMFFVLCSSVRVARKPEWLLHCTYTFLNSKHGNHKARQCKIFIWVLMTSFVVASDHTREREALMSQPSSTPYCTPLQSSESSPPICGRLAAVL